MVWMLVPGKTQQVSQVLEYQIDTTLPTTAVNTAAPGVLPSRRQRPLTLTSQRDPSRTIRVLSSGAYFLWVLVRTCRMKVLVY